MKQTHTITIGFALAAIGQILVKLSNFNFIGMTSSGLIMFNLGKHIQIIGLFIAFGSMVIFGLRKLRKKGLTLKNSLMAITGIVCCIGFIFFPTGLVQEQNKYVIN